MQAAILFQLVFLTFAVHSDDMKCYYCSSFFDLEKNCNDPFNKKMNDLYACTPTISSTPVNMYNAAAKVVNASTDKPETAETVKISAEHICVKIQFEYGQKTWIARDCVPKTGDFCFYLKRVSRKFKNGIKIPSCYTCEKDGCNEAGGTQAAFLAILVPCVALVLAENH